MRRCRRSEGCQGTWEALTVPTSKIGCGSPVPEEPGRHRTCVLRRRSEQVAQRSGYCPARETERVGWQSVVRVSHSTVEAGRLVPPGACGGKGTSGRTWHEVPHHRTDGRKGHGDARPLRGLHEIASDSRDGESELEATASFGRFSTIGYVTETTQPKGVPVVGTIPAH